jgi:hypothetical protein
MTSNVNFVAGPMGHFSVEWLIAHTMQLQKIKKNGFVSKFRFKVMHNFKTISSSDPHFFATDS